MASISSKRDLLFRECVYWGKIFLDRFVGPDLHLNKGQGRLSLLLFQADLFNQLGDRLVEARLVEKERLDGIPGAFFVCLL